MGPRDRWGELEFSTVDIHKRTDSKETEEKEATEIGEGFSMGRNGKGAGEIRISLRLLTWGWGKREVIKS